MGVHMLVNSVPPSGWRWQVFKDGKLVKSGTASSEIEARTAGNAAKREFES